MKKILLATIVLVLGFTQTSHAQLEEGNIMLGADIGSGLMTTTSSGLFGFNIGLHDDSGFNIGISPKVGYFLTEKFVLGAIVNIGYTNSGGEPSINTFTYGVQGLTRFYISPADADLDDVVPAGQFFMEMNAGIAGINVEDGPRTNGFAFGFGPGYSLFVTSSVALEASVKYNGLVGVGDPDYQHAIGINLGIQVFLPWAEAEDTIEEF